MKLHDLIDRLAKRKESDYGYCGNSVRREIVESFFAGADGHLDMEEPLNRISCELVKAGDKWIIFSKEMATPSKIVIVGTCSKKVAVHNLSNQFHGGLQALARL